MTDSSCEAFAGGEWRFEEDRENPPSRAYLKLWEWGYRTNSLPTKGQVALDLAACPGGWTWVLVKEGLHVHAYDRAPLDKRLMKRYGRQIEFSTGDIFKLSPDRAPKVDWVFCDVIAEPVRTFELIEKWLSEPVGLVFTIKFKGEKTKDDVELLSRLQRVPGASLRHLFVNKNEVTFWRPPQRRP
ncbi:MAG: SAM-dependent methyltransferase [Bdellovibrionales bacterium]|nr:SAM-dependent methyltransferase [Bdellovibrionales bacterium]